MSLENSLIDTVDDFPNPPFRDWPLVSVIVATYNRPLLLCRALESILAQTLRDMEVWVIHDGPLGNIDNNGNFTPNDVICAATAQVYAEYGKRFEAAGIDFYATAIEEHTGYYTTPRNVATENCRGVYVANLDDDNEWLPDALSSLLVAIEEGETWPDLVYGRRRYVLDPGAPTTKGDIDLKALEGDSQFVPWDDLALVRIAGNQPMFNFIDSSDFMVAKGALYRLGQKAGRIWDDGKRRFGDFYLVSDGLHLGEWRFKALDKVVQIYHISGDNISLTRPVLEVPREVKV
jgi:glycosyltransferase involved in cell wall biosynthesis